MVPATGEVLQGRYSIVSFLSKGGMGAVCQAWHLHLNIPVAIKEMLPQPDLDPNMLAQLRQQFQREAAVLARLDHPHLVNVTDFFVERGKAYLVMRFIEGENLAQRIEQQGALPEQEVLIWAEQLLDALAYCHAQGVIHRDVKPHNVIIRPDGRAVLVDFGLVKLWNPRDPRTRTAMRGMGTPEYAPPEQYDAQAGSGHTDARADVYGLGATLYHALTGRIPPTATKRIVDPAALAPVRKLNPKVSARTEAVIARALELRPSARFQSAVEMQAALAGAATDTAGTQVLPDKSTPVARVERKKAIPVRVWGLGAAAVVAVTALLMGVVLALGGGAGKATRTRQTEETATTVPAIVTGIVEKTAAPSPSLLPAATSRPTRTPPQRLTPTQAATVTPRPQSVTSTPVPPTATPIPSTPTQVPVATPTPAPRATAPEPVGPAQGGEYRSPVTFQWRGSLGAGQTYQITARHTGSGYVVQSGLLTDQSWTADLPADKYGEWRWTVTVVHSGRTLATSSEWMFWFNPGSGGGEGGGGGGGGGGSPITPAPP